MGATDICVVYNACVIMVYHCMLCIVLWYAMQISDEEVKQHIEKSIEEIHQKEFLTEVSDG